MGNESQTIKFTDANTNQSFGLRFVGTSELFQFKPSEVTNSFLGAGISALNGSNGLTCTVTGPLLSGSGTKTGNKLATWNGDLNLPMLEAISGAVRQFIVEDGDTDTYTWDGVEFDLGITESELQSLKRGLGGAHANEVIKGSSVAAGNVKENPVAVVTDIDTTPMPNLEDGNLNNFQSVPGGIFQDFGAPKSLTSLRARVRNCGGMSFHVTARESFPGAANDMSEEIFVTTDDEQWLELPVNNTTPFRHWAIEKYGGFHFDASEVEFYGDAVAGSASFTAYYDASVIPAQTTASGTNAVVTELVAAGSNHPSVSIESDTEGTSPAPVITAVSPSKFSAGDWIVITGQYFTGATKIEISGRPALDFTVVSDTEIRALVPNK
jgi:hypothetical protein